mgnify:CR=1 FL=1
MCGGVDHTRPFHSSGYEKGYQLRTIIQLMLLNELVIRHYPRYQDQRKGGARSRFWITAINRKVATKSKLVISVDRANKTMIYDILGGEK